MRASWRTRPSQPERPALRDGAQRLSYRELDERSNRLAHALRARGMGRGERVGLCLDRGFDMFVALLAVLKSGAAYVPLDPAFPQARLDYYAEDAKLGLLLTASTDRRRAARPGARTPPSACCCSTATPPGSTQPADAAAARPAGRAGRGHGLRDLHLRLDRQAQGRVRAAPRGRQPDADHAARARHRRRTTGWPP